MLVEKLDSSNFDLLNQNNLDKGSLLNISDDYSNFNLFPQRGEIKIKTVNWDKKELTYELILQGKSIGVKKAVFGKNNTSTYESKKKDFTFSIDNTTNGDDNIMTLVLYRGLLGGVPKSEYKSITLDAKSISFNKKTIKDIADRTKLIDSKESISTINQLTDIVDTLVNNKQDGLPIGDVGNAAPSKSSINKEETKILGLSPVTFGLISLGVIALGATIITIKLIKNKAIKA
jgi:hypothetical protein